MNIEIDVYLHKIRTSDLYICIFIYTYQSKMDAIDPWSSLRNLFVTEFLGRCVRSDHPSMGEFLLSIIDCSMFYIYKQ